MFLGSRLSLGFVCLRFVQTRRPRTRVWQPLITREAMQTAYPSRLRPVRERFFLLHNRNETQHVHPSLTQSPVTLAKSGLKNFH